MPLRIPLIFLAVTLLVTAGLHAQQQPALPANAELILRDLDALEKQRKQLMLTAWRAALATVREGADQGSAAASLYKKAVEETKYEGKANKAASYTNWKDKYGDALQSKEMQAVLLLHLKYLELSLQRNEAEHPELFVAPSLEFARELAASDIMFLKQERTEEKLKLERDRGEKITDREKENQDIIQKVTTFRKELLERSLKDSVFTKWLRLEQWLPGKDWELIPGNLSGILAKNVRPYMRAAKNPQIGDTWIFEMQFLADRVAFSRLQHDAVDFDTVIRPEMQFNRANDLIEIGDLKGGVNEIYTIAKTYPQHADFPEWVGRLRELLAPAPAEGAAPEPISETATPTPSGTSPQ